MIKNNIWLFLVMILVLSGCAQKKESISSTDSAADSQEKTEHISPEMESNDVVNLPDELYQADQSANADLLRYDFKVEEKMELTITVEVSAGTIHLGIKDRDSRNYVYDMKEFQTETDSVTLEKGKYSVEVEQSDFTGSYRIKGTPAQ